MTYCRRIMNHGIGMGVIMFGQIFWLKDLSHVGGITLYNFFWVAHQEWKTRQERALGAMPDMFKNKKLRKPLWMQQPELAPALGEAVRLCISGYTIRQCLDYLHQNTTYTKWNVKFLSDTFRGRRLVGELKGVKDYYPAVIDEDTWAKLQTRLDKSSPKQMKRTGGPRTECGNLFPIPRWSIRPSVAQGVKYPYLVSQRGLDRQEPYQSFRYDYLEPALLRMIRELTPADLYPTANVASQVGTLEAELAAVENKITAVKGKIAADEELKELYEDEWKRLMARRKVISAELTRARAEMPAPVVLGETQDLIQLLNTASDKIDIRTRVKQAIRNLIDKITITVENKIAYCTVNFVSGRVRRVWVSKTDYGFYIPEGGGIAIDDMNWFCEGNCRVALG